MLLLHSHFLHIKRVQPRALQVPDSYHVVDGCSGEISESIFNLTNLNYLDLSYNKLSGEISTEIGNLTNLTLLNLVNNDLTLIPESFCNIKNKE